MEYGSGLYSANADSSLVQAKAARNFRSSMNNQKVIRGKSSLDKMFHNELLTPHKRHNDLIHVGASDIEIKPLKTIQTTPAR